MRQWEIRAREAEAQAQEYADYIHELETLAADLQLANAGLYDYVRRSFADKDYGENPEVVFIADFDAGYSH